ncbi:MAG TPA: hypothetical protein HPP56_07165, partial [Nitrospirae bacterium]|nr:hypothetical protein [Nitrospirota bacterium]
EEAQRKSKEIIYLLTMLEYKILRNYQSVIQPQDETKLKDKLSKETGEGSGLVF